MPIRSKRNQYLYDKLIELYTLLYKEAYPSVDFREMVNNTRWIKYNVHPAEYFNMTKEDRDEYDKTFVKYDFKEPNELSEDEALAQGYKRDVPYNDYFLETNRYDKIVNDFINDKNNKFGKVEKRLFRTEAYLGCGPAAYKESDLEGMTIEEYCQKRRDQNHRILETNIVKE